MTLVEVVIAVALAAMLSAGMYGSAIYTMRQTAKNVDHLYAVQLASSEAAAVRAGRFGKLAAETGTLTDADYEFRFNGDKEVTQDPNHPHSPKYTVKYNFSGFGEGITLDGSGPDATLSLPKGAAKWKKNEFRNHMLVITGGDGVNQVMRIVSNERGKGGKNNRTVEVKLTSDLTGADTDENWLGKKPSANSVWAVDYGLYCDVEVSWDDGEGYKTIKETVYVPCSQ